MPVHGVRFKSKDVPKAIMMKRRNAHQRIIRQIPSLKNISNIVTVSDGNILDATRFLRLFYRLGGLDVYEYKQLPNGDVAASVSWVGVSSTVSGLALYFWCLYLGTLRDKSISASVFPSLMKSYSTIISRLVATVLLIYTSTILSRDIRQREFLNKIEKIDAAIRDLDLSVDYKILRRISYAITGCQVLAFGIIILITYIEFTSWGIEIQWRRILSQMYSFYVLSACLTRTYYFWYILRTRYCLINIILSGLLYSSRDVADGSMWARLARSNGNTGVFHQMRTLDSINAVSKLFFRTQTLRISLDKCFGTSLLLVVLNIFILLIISAFSVIESSAGGFMHYNKLIYFLFVYNIVKFVFGFCGVYEIVRSCEKVYSEVAKTTNIINSIIIKSNSDEVKKAASSLSLQMLHQHHKFSANGLFHLDYKLITAMAGSLATYLIVLLQFLSDESPPPEVSSSSSVRTFTNASCV